jgi:multidrug efflux system membrane fusion protein
VQEIHFREGALVKQGDLLVTVDPAPYQAVVDSAAARVVAAQSQLAWAHKEQDRGQQLLTMTAGAISQSSVDQRINAAREADASLRAAQADLQAARLNLGYTEIHAPVSGRVGKIQITVGNLIAAGPASPVLTTLVSVDPIYGSFDADEQVVTQALKTLGAGANAVNQLDRIPVEMVTAAGDDTPIKGHLQLIDNQVDAQSGTVRLRAVFDNPNGTLIPGQFARLRMGASKTEPVLAVNERALGTDQDKRFVMVVDAGNKAAYREVTLGALNGNLRVVTSGLNPGERVVVDGLQRVRPGVLVSPTDVPMDKTELTQR